MRKLKPRTIFDEETKFSIVMRSFMKGNTVKSISEEYGIDRKTLSHWRKEFMENGPKIFNQKTQKQTTVIPEKEYNRAIRENNLLKKLLEHYKKTRG